MFTNPQPPKGCRKEQFTKIKWDWMKCQHLHRRLMFVNPHQSWGCGRVWHQCTKYFPRNWSHVANPYPSFGVGGWGPIYQKCFLEHKYMSRSTQKTHDACPGLHVKIHVSQSPNPHGRWLVNLQKHCRLIVHSFPSEKLIPTSTPMNGGKGQTWLFCANLDIHSTHKKIFS